MTALPFPDYSSQTGYKEKEGGQGLYSLQGNTFCYLFAFGPQSVLFFPHSHQFMLFIEKLSFDHIGAEDSANQLKNPTQIRQTGFMN